ncbi:MAG: hypothetical protein AAF202_05695, partial [Pseudomonadota bacterium]
WPAKKEFPELPLVVVGQSLGGAISMRALGESSDKIKPKVVLIESSFLNYRSVARSVMSKHWLTWILQPIAWLVADNSKAAGDVVAEISTGCMIVSHGTWDPVIDFQFGERIFEKAPSPKGIWTLKNAGHIPLFASKDMVDEIFSVFDSGQCKSLTYDYAKIKK